MTIGLAVTREGIPVRCWVLPGNQHDSQCVDQVQKDLNDWNLSDRDLSAEDIALGYKKLMEVERALRTLKSTLCLRPVYHSKDDRIRSYVLLCWLALLLVRIAEVETGLTWPKIRSRMQQLHPLL